MVKFLKLFPNKERILNAEIEYSEHSSFNVKWEKPDTTLQEYFILGLLIYARMIKFSNTELQNKMHGMLMEIKELNDKRVFLTNNKLYDTYKSLNSNSYNNSQRSSWKISLRKYCDTNLYYLHTSAPNTKNYDSLVYISFFFIFEKIGDNKENFINAFLKLGEINLHRQFSVVEAISIPNELEKQFFSPPKYD